MIDIRNKLLDAHIAMAKVYGIVKDDKPPDRKATLEMLDTLMWVLIALYEQYHLLEVSGLHKEWEQYADEERERQKEFQREMLDG
jgi:hypothetical protein